MDEPTKIGSTVWARCQHEAKEPIFRFKEGPRELFTRFSDFSGVKEQWIAKDGVKHLWSDLIDPKTSEQWEEW